MDSQQVSNSTSTTLKINLTHLIKEDYSIGADTARYQSVLELALSKVDFSIGKEINMLPNNLNLNIGKTVG